jgi:hypothetical protein
MTVALQSRLSLLTVGVRVQPLRLMFAKMASVAASFWHCLDSIYWSFSQQILAVWLHSFLLLPISSLRCVRC